MGRRSDRPGSALPAEFLATYPRARPRAPFVPARHAAFAARVPAQLAAEWRHAGFGAYGGGAWWTVDPALPLLDPSDWPGLDGSGIEVLRSAFADVCVWQGGRFLLLDILRGDLTFLGSRVDVMFGYSLLRAQFRRDVLWEPLMRVAVKRLGRLAADECYGFAPLPALGGAIAADHLIKTELGPYVALTAQLR